MIDTLFFLLGLLIGYLIGYYIRVSSYSRQIEILIQEVQKQEEQVHKLIIATQRASATSTPSTLCSESSK